MNGIDKLVEEQKKNLPSELVRAIENTSWQLVVKSIGKENNLSEDQTDILERETLLILYGFEDPTRYTDNLGREMKISQPVAEKIFDSVWEKIMNPISKKAGEKEKDKGKQTTQISQEIHPMVEPGEVAHTVPHVEQPTPKPPTPQVSQPNPVNFQQPTSSQPPKPLVQPKSAPKAEQSKEKVSLPDYRYPEGKDPYREPIK